MKQLSFRVKLRLWKDLDNLSKKTKLSKTALLRIALDTLIQKERLDLD